MDLVDNKKYSTLYSEILYIFANTNKINTNINKKERRT